MVNTPIDLDKHRDREKQIDTELRRQHQFLLSKSQEEAIRSREKLEGLFLSSKAETWPDVAAKAEYLIKLFSATNEGSIPRNEKLIKHVLYEMDELHKQREET